MNEELISEVISSMNRMRDVAEKPNTVIMSRQMFRRYFAWEKPPKASNIKRRAMYRKYVARCRAVGIHHV